MTIAGTQLGDAAVAELALVLRRAGEVDLAQYIGHAIDNGRDVLDLNRRDCDDILRVLDDPPVSLVELRGGLLQEAMAYRREELG
jgi:hypothetical protein